MSQQLSTTQSPLARWSRNVAVFSAQLLVAAIVLHRLASLPTPVTLNILLTALGGAAVAILLAFGAYITIWRDGRPGAWSATTGLLIGLALMAWPAALVPFYREHPAIHDLSTDTASPPAFAALAKARPSGANPAAYPGGETTELQLLHYPDIRPVLVPRSTAETWEVIGETVRRLKWTIVSETPPGAGARGSPGVIEAVDRTLVLGFYDDVVIRVRGDARETRIDVRSASRYGVSDFGRNATRIRRLFKEIHTRLDAIATGGDRPRGRRARPETAVPKLPKGAAAALKSKQKEGRDKAGASSKQQPARSGKQQGKQQ